MTNIKVDLEQKHIDHGTACNSGSCPAALAITEALPGVHAVKVESWTIYLYRTSGHTFGMAVDTPDSVTNFIKDFDRGRPVKPFSFNLDVPDWAVKA